MLYFYIFYTNVIIIIGDRFGAVFIENINNDEKLYYISLDNQFKSFIDYLS